MRDPGVAAAATAGGPPWESAEWRTSRARRRKSRPRKPGPLQGGRARKGSRRRFMPRPRPKYGPFVEIHCAACPPTFSIELFGYERGALTEPGPKPVRSSWSGGVLFRMK